MRRILVVDDDAVTCDLLADVLGDDRTVVVGHTDPRAALDLARTEPLDLALVDVQMPEIDGLTLLSQLRECRPDLPIVVMTGFGSIDTAVQAIGSGAADYLSKPMNVDEVRAIVARILLRCGEPAAALPPTLEASDGVVGRSPAMVEVYKAVARVAATRASVLILGETGTGKEMIARAIHRHSARRRGRFVAVDCAALGDQLLESELFGHVRGAFTGAIDGSPGLVAEADGGTIFLDEIGDVSPALQARLLRVLQEREVRPVGGTRWRSVDVRVVAATHRDLAGEVAAGRFREDLYYRLRVVTIVLPPLRDRIEDLPLLVQYFVRRAAQESGKAISGVSRAALAVLERHHWPGNVRELAHVVERAVVLAPGDVLTEADFAPLVAAAANGGAPEPGDDRIAAVPPAPRTELAADRPTLRELVRRYTVSVLAESEGNVSRAAAVLGIDRRSLHRMLKRFAGDDRGEAPPPVGPGRPRAAEPATRVPAGGRGRP